MFNIGPAEFIVIAIIALIVFGPKRLPEIGRTVGRSLREFRKASQDLKDELNLNLDDSVPGNRPAPGEPGYENWRTEEQGPSQNGGPEHAAAPPAPATEALDTEPLPTTGEGPSPDPSGENEAAG